MIPTEEVVCPKCRKSQSEDIHDLVVDSGEFEGTFTHLCEFCKEEFKVEFAYKPYVTTY